MSQYFYAYDSSLDRILRYADEFWVFILQLYYRIIGRNCLNLNLHKKKRKTWQQRYCLYQICIILIFMMISLVSFINLSSPLKYPEILETYDVRQSVFLLANQSITLNIHNRSTHYIYIDIGCYNGETIEHFIHFTPNSVFYDIITFEPDPENYQLCKRKLSQPKYKHYNIIIIPKVVWIHNGKVLYHIDRGQRSRIYRRRTNDASNLAELDAIDFSSWLRQIITSNNTKTHIKISMPGTETRVLRKLVVDDTLQLADKWDVEWSDRNNPHTFTQRIYLQLMFDSFGFHNAGFTRLQDVRKVFRRNETYQHVTRYTDLRKLSDIDTYTHYIQRDIVTDPPRTRKPRVNSKKL